MHREPSLVIIRSLMRGLELDREYPHSRAQGYPAPQYVEIREDVNHHREIEPELRALGYEHAWQQKRWRVLQYSRYAAVLSSWLRQEDRSADERSTPIPGKGYPLPRSAILGDFMEVA